MLAFLNRTLEGGSGEAEGGSRRHGKIEKREKREERLGEVGRIFGQKREK